MVLSSTNISESERESYDNVLGKLDEYFHVRHNSARASTDVTRWKVSPGPVYYSIVRFGGTVLMWITYF